MIQFFPGREYINSVQERKKNEAEFLFLIRQIALHTSLATWKWFLGGRSSYGRLKNLPNLSVKALHLLAYGPWRKSCMHNYCWAEIARSPLFSRIRENRLATRPGDQNLSTTAALVDTCMTKASRRLGFFFENRERHKRNRTCVIYISSFYLCLTAFYMITMH